MSFLGCHNTIQQAEGIKHQRFSFSQFWGPEVRDQGVGRFGFSGGRCSELTDSCLLVASPGLSSLYIPGASPPLTKPLVRLEEGPPWRSQFTLLTPLKDLCPNKPHSEVLEARATTFDFCGEHNLAHNWQSGLTLHRSTQASKTGYWYKQTRVGQHPSNRGQGW